MTLTDMLCLLLGVYAAAAGLGFLVNPAKAGRLMATLGENPAVSYVTGALVYFFCGGVLIAHHGASSWKETLVTAIYALGALEGLLFLIIPARFMGLFTSLLTPAFAQAWGGLALVFGAGLTAIAFL